MLSYTGRQHVKLHLSVFKDFWKLILKYKKTRGPEGPEALTWPCGYKLEFILKLKIKRNDWLLADTCPQAANHCALFRV